MRAERLVRTAPEAVTDSREEGAAAAGVLVGGVVSEHYTKDGE
jgi:hypothetical protein